jgi:hypothetical protein
MSVGVTFKFVVSQATICNHLLAYLSVVDYINLRRATVNCISRQLPSPAQLVSRRLVRRLKHDLEFTEENVDHLMKALAGAYADKDLNGGEAAFTGGFLLAVLRGESFDAERQDIDIFASFYNDGNWGFLEPPEDVDNHEQYDDLMPFARIFNYKMQNTRVQFVMCRRQGVPQAIRAFDMSICKNAFIPDRGVLYIDDLEGLTRQQCVVNVDSVVRGIYKVQFRDTLFPLYEREKKRIDKYRARGYDVRVVHAPRNALGDMFVMDPDQAGVFDPDEMYMLMGCHAPPSCVFTPDCRCQNTRDPNVRYCIQRSEIGCDCEHHRVYYRTLRERWVARKRQRFVEEYERCWLRAAHDGEN